MSWKDRFSRKKQIDAQYWREIFWSKKKAKEALVNLMVPDENGKPRSVKEVTLENGQTIPVSEVTEEQAHEFMKALCPDWAFDEASRP